MVKGLFVESVNNSIFCCLRKGRSEHQSVSFKNLAKKRNLLPAFRGTAPTKSWKQKQTKSRTRTKRVAIGDINAEPTKGWTWNICHRQVYRVETQNGRHHLTAPLTQRRWSRVTWSPPWSQANSTGTTRCLPSQHRSSASALMTATRHPDLTRCRTLPASSGQGTALRLYEKPTARR